MTLLLECIMLSENEDVPRFIELIENRIMSGELKKYKIFDKTKNKVKLLKDESEEVK